MNALLQALFHTPEFRNAVHMWHYEGEVVDGAPEQCIPFQTQRFFAAMQLAEAGFIQTKVILLS